MIPQEFPALHLRAADGASAEIAIDGAHITSWIPAGTQDDLMFVSAQSHFGPGASIRGGVPVIFPQFGSFGALPQHGLVRTRRWQVIAQHAGEARLRIADDETTRAIWPHAFTLELVVGVAGHELSISLIATNTDVAAWEFTAALHPYFRVREAFAAHVIGLRGLRYRDALEAGAVFTETGETLPITGPLDRIYYDAPSVIHLRDGARTIAIEKQGFTDAVVWNPGEVGTRSRTDFVVGEEHQMLCVESATIGEPVVLAPGATWTGVQRLAATLHAG